MSDRKNICKFNKQTETIEANYNVSKPIKIPQSNSMVSKTKIRVIKITLTK